MDEPSAIMGANHRKYRHDPNITPKEAKAIFGENADNACLDHIRLDKLEKRKNNYTTNSYGSWTFKAPIMKLQKLCNKCGNSCDAELDICPICKSGEFNYSGKHTVCSKCNRSFDVKFGKCPNCGSTEFAPK